MLSLVDVIHAVSKVGMGALKPKRIHNRMKLIRDYKQQALIASGTPNILYVESTNRCNLDCVMCPRRLMHRNEVNMAPALFKHVIGQLDKKLVELVVLHSDGEPLLNPHIFEMIRFAKGRGFKVMTSTNATLLDTNAARELVESGLDILTLSMDGNTKETYETIRRGANYDAVCRNVYNFLNIKGSRSPMVVMQMIVMKENEHEVDAYLHNWGRFKGINVFPVAKPMMNWFERRKDVVGDEAKCDRPWFGMVIHSNGNVVPCVHDYDGKQVIGRVQDTPVMEIWNSPRMLEVRKALGCSRSGNHLCEDCNATPPRTFDLASTVGLCSLDMATIARILPILGYKRPKQY